MADLKAEFDWYLLNQSELVGKYNGKVIVIKGGQVIGVFATEVEAVAETTKAHELGTFLVHRCGPGRENYTVTFYSPRVSFA